MEASGESPAQRQTRLRREKREKKILEGGSSRLEKITGLSGRPAPSEDEPPANAASSAPPPYSAAPAQSSQDPDEVDISSHPYTAQSRATPNDPATEAEMRRLLRSRGGPGQNGSSTGFQQPPDADGQGGQDEMMRLLQQIMGTMPGMPGGEGPGGGDNPTAGLPPGLAAMLGGMPPAGGGPGGPASTSEASKNAYVWKIVHALFALALGLYITLYAYPSFSGTLAARTLSATPLELEANNAAQTRVFWAFSTAELGLQSARYLLEKGQSESGGWVGTVLGFLPEPWKSRGRLVQRYSGIWTTLVEDAMVVVFVVGLAAWWRQGVDMSL